MELPTGLPAPAVADLDGGPPPEPPATGALPDPGTPPDTDTTDALALADRVLDEVEQALVRLDQGTYGTCESCGRAVDDDRLAEFPTARVCETCAPAA